MRYILTLLTAIFFYSASFAQSTGKISGQVIDDGAKPIHSATVSLLTAKDSALVKIAVTDKAGNFEYQNIADSAYLVSVSFVGFEKAYSDVVTILGGNTINLKAIKLAPETKNMEGVVVQSKRPLVENKIDKMVVNVDASPTNAGTTALEVLEKSPGISVDRDGNISLKGKAGVIVLVDGKQTYLSGEDLANLLRNMPSSQLDQIEIMTQPSSKYDAAGNSGVLNIKTKKSKQTGFNGTVNLGYIQGFYPKTSNSVNFNYRKGKFNVFSNLSYSRWSNYNTLELTRIFRKDGEVTSVFNQETRGRYVGNNYNVRVGVDYSIDKNTTIGIGWNGAYNPREWNSKSQSNILNGFNKLDSVNKAASSTKDPWKNMGMNVNFRKILDTNGKELTADLDYVQYISKNNQSSNNFNFDNLGNPLGDPLLLRGYLPSNITIYSAKVDYVHPLNSTTKFEAGAKSSYVSTDNDARYTLFDHENNDWDTDVARSNHFLYQENINAAYINFNKQIKKWGFQSGLRFEHTHSLGHQKTTKEKTIRDYAQLFPTAYVSYNLNDKNTFGLSYSRRVQRPNYSSMNPFQYFLDQYTYQQGNPYLTPEFSHNIELSHNFSSKLNTTFNYSATTDIISEVFKQNNDTKVTFVTNENIANRKSYGVAVSYNAPITKWWTTSMYVNASNNHFKGIVNNRPLDAAVTGFMGNMSQQFKFAKVYSAEISGFYRSKMQEDGMMISNPMGVFSFGFGKQILKTKGTIKLNITDPFHVMQFSGYSQFGDIDITVKNKWDNRRVGLSFTYRFSKGQNPQAQPRRRGSSAQDEQNRVGGGDGQ